MTIEHPERDSPAGRSPVGRHTLDFDGGPKRATNLSLNVKVLEAARELGMNVSQTVDALVAAEVRRRYWERWNDENREAVDAYNARITRDGLPLARHRAFARGG